MRLKILSQDEADTLYGLPRFTQEERDEYFSLSTEEKAALEQLHSHKSRLFFILQLGYFKARQMFFVFNLAEVEEDAAYIKQRYFPGLDDIDSDIAKGTRLKQQGMILEICRYRNADTNMRRELEKRARQTATVFGKPLYVFRELVHYLAEQRVVVPGYTTMQEIVGRALTHEQRRLARIVDDHVDLPAKATLSRLLEDTQGLHEITLLKRDPRDFSNQEIRREMERGAQMRTLYELSQKLLPHLNISKENVRYYASLVDYYSVHRLRQLSDSTLYVYLLCFIQHRYQELHDNLIQSLLHHVRKHGSDAKGAAKDLVYAARTAVNEDIPKGGEILKLFTDSGITDNTPFDEVRQKAFAVLPEARLNAVAEYLGNEAQFDETEFEWQHLDKAAHRFKLTLRPILHGVEFATYTSGDPLMEAARFLKEASQSGKPLGVFRERDIPLRWVPEKMKPYLYEKDERHRRRLLPDRYEFLLYRQLRNSMEAGDIFCHDSIRFRSMKDDLISDEQWRKHRDALIAETGRNILQKPIGEHLAELKEQLETCIAEVNRRIAAGENGHFKRKGNERWTLEYPGGETEHSSFFDRLPQVDINSILHFTDQQCRFTGAFTHLVGRFGKQTLDIPALTVCLVAWGTNMGIGRMGQLSDIGYHILASTSDNFLRPETLREANDIISNAIAQLPIFRHYDIGGVIHSSSDGQKVESSVRTFNARHSPKYWGLQKGIVPYTACANHVPINAFNIAADEHESHFVFDILFNNSTDIKPGIHSTDTHGTNEVNFALLYVFGYQFAPRYKDICDKVRTSLTAFQHPSRYDESAIIKPIRKIRETTIIQEWDECCRIFVSLARKETTQSTIVRKLSSHARNNRTKQALWEYDSIHRSLYLLNYIDSPSLRQNVQKALNRGENYHQLRRAISFASFGKMRFKTEYEQDLWLECSRLITNCIVFYNALLLSRLLEYHEKNDNTLSADMIKKVSPIAWQHINPHGRYEFQKLPDGINIDAMVRELTELSPNYDTLLIA